MLEKYGLCASFTYLKGAKAQELLRYAYIS